MPPGGPKNSLDLLPMVFARPNEAVTAARALLTDSVSPFDASVAYQAIGIFERDFGDVTASIAALRRARDLARRSGSADRETDVLGTLGAALVFAGRTRQGLATLGAALIAAEGLAAAQVRHRRAAAFWTLGRHAEAMDDFRVAMPVLREAGDTIWLVRALSIRGTVRLAMGEAAAADRDFAEAEQLCAETRQDVDMAMAIENRGLAASRSGDVPAALSHFDEAARRYAVLGTPMYVLHVERSGLLLMAGLAQDALTEADQAIKAIEQARGQPIRRAELLLSAARAALAAGDPDASAVRAGEAMRVFARQRRDWWRTHARLVHCQARFATGGHTARLFREAEDLARRLAALNSPESVPAALLAGRVALALNRFGDADRMLATAMKARLKGPPLARVEGWLAYALRAEAAGQNASALTACRRGLDVLDQYRLTLGATELRARATARGGELAVLAQRISLRTGSTRRLLEWSERWRATTLAVPPVRPPDDPDLLRDLTAFREIHNRIESGGKDLTRELRRLEDAIRSRSYRISGAGGVTGRLDSRELLSGLGGHLLIEISELDGELYALLCGQGRVRKFRAGRAADALTELGYVRAGLHRLSYHASAERLAVVEAGGRRLQELLLGPAAARLGTGPVIVVPPARLHGVPWAVLPAFHDRVHSAAPSADAWLRTLDKGPGPDRVVLVQGPGLTGGADEVSALAAGYDKPAVLGRGRATAEAVLVAMDGCGLAHLAAHGTFRSDSPMFSALRMDDGPLSVHDLERLRRAPYRIVLPSCDSARLEQVGADELLGLASALLPLGTAGIVAAVVPVNDQAAVALMLALHEALRAGRSMAEALRDARRALPPDPLHQATGLSFVAIGAA
jgi:tetratricopeptide (TPR) repeat protein